MKWRLIEQETYSAAMNMAIDNAIYESVANGRELPTIRFYKWLNNSISIGAYQNPKEIDIITCKNNKVDIVRRITGGRAVFHDKVDFTYSFIAPVRIFGYSIEKAYRHVCFCIIDALHDLDIKSTLENKNDVVVDGKKISGNAAKAMDKGMYLQHGTLVYDINFGLVPKALNVPEDVIADRVTSVLAHKKLSQKKVYETLRENFTYEKDFNTEELSKFELMRAEELARTKYNSIMLPASSFMRNKGACYVERGG